MLVFEVDEHRWDACFLQLGDVGQLPPNGAASPADAEDYPVCGLHLLFCELYWIRCVGLLHRPVDVGIVHLKTPFQRDGDVRLAADADVDRLAVDAVKQRRKRKSLNRKLYPYRTETLTDPVVRCHFLPPEMLKISS